MSDETLQADEVGTPDKPRVYVLTIYLRSGQQLSIDVIKYKIRQANGVVRFFQWTNAPDTKTYKAINLLTIDVDSIVAITVV